MAAHDPHLARTAWAACVVEHAPVLAPDRAGEIVDHAHRISGGHEVIPTCTLLRSLCFSGLPCPPGGASDRLRRWCLFIERALLDTCSPEPLASVRGADLTRACRIALAAVSGPATALAAAGAPPELVARAHLLAARM